MRVCTLSFFVSRAAVRLCAVPVAAAALLFLATVGDNAPAAVAAGAQKQGNKPKAGAAIPATAPWPHPGEARFDGTVEAFLPDESGFVLLADKMTQPDGTVITFDPPLPKTIAVGMKTLIRASSAAGQKLVLGDLTQGHVVFAVGKNLGKGKSLPARYVFRTDPRRDGEDDGGEEEMPPDTAEDEAKPTPPTAGKKPAPAVKPQPAPPVKPGSEESPKPETIPPAPATDEKPAPPPPQPRPMLVVEPEGLEEEKRPADAKPTPAPAPAPAAETGAANLLKPITDTAAWRLRQIGEAQGTAAYEEGAIKVTVGAVDGTFWHVQLFHETTGIEAGKTYKLTFRAKAEKPGRMQITSELLSEENPNTGLDMAAHLATEWRVFEKTFKARDIAPGVRHALPNFSVGFQKGTVWIDSVSLVEVAAP